MENIFISLKEKYFKPIGMVLKGKADVASVFPNRPDIGNSREKVYAEFLKQHLPSQCNINYGGFLFNYDGLESKQIDLFVTTDSIPQFNFHNMESEGKTFAPVEGTAAAITIKSKLDKTQLIEALDNLKSIPLSKKERIKLPSYFKLPEDIDDYLLYKIIFAFDSVESDSIKEILDDYFKNNNVPISRRPNLIHIAGKYSIVRAVSDNLNYSDGTTVPVGNYVCYKNDPDVLGLLHAILGIHESSYCFNHIIVVHQDLLNKMDFNW